MLLELRLTVVDQPIDGRVAGSRCFQLLPQLERPPPAALGRRKLARRRVHVNLSGELVVGCRKSFREHARQGLGTRSRPLSSAQ